MAGLRSRVDLRAHLCTGHNWSFFLFYFIFLNQKKLNSFLNCSIFSASPLLHLITLAKCIKHLFEVKELFAKLDLMKPCFVDNDCQSFLTCLNKLTFLTNRNYCLSALRVAPQVVSPTRCVLLKKTSLLNASSVASDCGETVFIKPPSSSDLASHKQHLLVDTATQLVRFITRMLWCSMKPALSHEGQCVGKSCQNFLWIPRGKPTVESQYKRE